MIHKTQRLKRYFFEQIVPAIQDTTNIPITQIPQLQKIVLNRGIGEVSPEIFASSLKEFQKITGQKALIRYSKKPIAGFNLKKKNANRYFCYFTTEFYV